MQRSKTHSNADEDDAMLDARGVADFGLETVSLLLRLFSSLALFAFLTRSSAELAVLLEAGDDLRANMNSKSIAHAHSGTRRTTAYIARSVSTVARQTKALSGAADRSSVPMSSSILGRRRRQSQRTRRQR